MKKLVPMPPESLKHFKKDDLKDFGYQFVSRFLPVNGTCRSMRTAESL
jgi:hypothetical protein